MKLELNKWEKSYFDVETLQNNVVEVNSLHEKIELLEKRIEVKAISAMSRIMSVTEITFFINL